ncbi:hypothetical protein SAMN05428961_103613 [Paenibacillus sp. OK060]|uniref:hypothetical protein n=1 Tax=Paenibacillus sp. OK060 TaxID=1881034 RepID=UPI00087E9015|nr:hypothetical protein [Paenibacillus sp. OK060]SDL02993.1 hypothetical protein SAMN05428961_103613 [Paenibacillus sp. OK060]
MKHKKELSVLLLGAALIIGASSVFASDPSTPVTVSSETITSNGSYIDEFQKIQPRKNNLVISDSGVSMSNGTYLNLWNQPAAWSYYRFSVKNTTATSVTVTIQEHGNSKSHTLAANSSNSWNVAGVPAGDHTISVTTSDGRKFTGDVAVTISNSFPF